MAMSTPMLTLKYAFLYGICDISVVVTFVQVNNAPHKAELSHELIAGAAAYEVLSPSCLLTSL
jgi:Protein of unknown function (DUF3759)